MSMVNKERELRVAENTLAAFLVNPADVMKNFQNLSNQQVENFLRSRVQKLTQELKNLQEEVGND